MASKKKKQKHQVRLKTTKLYHRYGNLPDFVSNIENDLDKYREGFVYQGKHILLKDTQKKENKPLAYTLNGNSPTITIIFQIKYLDKLPMANFLRQVKYNDETIETKKFVWFKEAKQENSYNVESKVHILRKPKNERYTLPAAYQFLLKDIFEKYLTLNKDKYIYTYLPNLPQEIGLTTTGKRLRPPQKAAIVSMNKLKVKRGGKEHTEEFEDWRKKYRDTKFPVK